MVFNLVVMWDQCVIRVCEKSALSSDVIYNAARSNQALIRLSSKRLQLLNEERESVSLGAEKWRARKREKETMRSQPGD